MHLTFQNVTHAFNQMVSGIQTGSLQVVEKNSRNGPVMKFPETMVITYLNPTQRVLFCPGRDANPFFHLYESLWMLTGRDDVAPLKYFTSKIEQFSDDGEVLNGAYGARWRYGKCYLEEQGVGAVDQINILIKHLQEQPDSRRAVLQMWNIEQDLLKIDNQFKDYSKDVCCNLSVKFSIREETVDDEERRVLDMTVFNRSNDMILGMFGANVVHFSFLQEYMAGRLGLGVGRYNQVTDDLHVYKSNWHPDKWFDIDRSLRDAWGGRYPAGILPLGFNGSHTDEVVEKGIQILVEDAPGMVEYSFHELADELSYTLSKAVKVRGDCIEWLATVAYPMFAAFALYKQNRLAHAIATVKAVESADWQKAAYAWLWKRYVNRKTKDGWSLDPYTVRAELDTARRELGLEY